MIIISQIKSGFGAFFRFLHVYFRSKFVMSLIQIVLWSFVFFFLLMFVFSKFGIHVPFIPALVLGSYMALIRQKTLVGWALSLGVFSLLWYLFF